jgi:hypothetical protein
MPLCNLLSDPIFPVVMTPSEFKRKWSRKLGTMLKLFALSMPLLVVPDKVQAQWEFITNSGSITITKYTGSDGNVTIPSTTNALPVTCIGSFAFQFCTSLTSITIPSSVTNIGWYAFGSCTSMSAINVNALNSFYCSVDGVLFNKSTNTLIQCPGGKVGSYTIPNSVTSIGVWAFGLCVNLTDVTIPNSVINIGNYAFVSCSSMSAINVNALNSFYCSVDGVLFNKSTNTLIQCPGDRVGSYTIPNSVTNIGISAFHGCTRLASATVPNSVTSIGFDAFCECASMTTISIPDSVTSIEEHAFYYCTSLTNVAIPNNITRICQSTFQGCANLTAISIPDSVTSIEKYAFKGCMSLTSVTIPNNVTAIGAYAFCDCTNLTNVNIGNGVTAIGEYAFYECTSLTNVIIGNSVTSIGNFAFFYSTSLPVLFNIYFKGNAPSIEMFTFSGSAGPHTTLYYMPGTTGWNSRFGACRVVLWNPLVQSGDASFGVRTNGFGFNIVGTSNLVIVVEACTNLVSPVWSPVSTNTLNTCIGTNGSSHFSDPQWTNYPGRFYRLRSP